jgi:alkanesulfonate monooxygenase SsuD/methylene tetrahydromethanopterin reductase-like flavin-dependent oxidoreductase (luciferase family)
MRFDIFHSIGRIDTVLPRLSERDIFLNFREQCREAESMGFETIWVAESHFSSEVQKTHKRPVIPNYQGEVGLNADSFQLAHWVFNQTQKIGFGTAIHNIVGGSGGPIASADRVRSLMHFNSLLESPRSINIGFAAGRFPYINSPFGIVPRNRLESILWPQIQRLIFLEATEIFLRLLRGEVVSSDAIRKHDIDASLFRSSHEYDAANTQAKSEGLATGSWNYDPRWTFESLGLVPDVEPSTLSHLRFVLGSHDPLARDLALNLADIDVFNLSFTPPEEINKIHNEMFERYQAMGRSWARWRLPRTVLIFIDKSSAKAYERAERCFDTYIEAMRGTVQMPPRDQLMSRALIGSPEEIIEQLDPAHVKGFNKEDRLMLWFEFNQTIQSDILAQMQIFSDKVAPHYRIGGTHAGYQS